MASEELMMVGETDPWMVETVTFAGQQTSLEVGLQLSSDPILVSISEKRNTKFREENCRGKERSEFSLFFFF